MNASLLLFLSAALAQTTGGAGKPADTQLAEGNPPLTQAVADAWAGLVGFALDTTLTPDQKRSLQAELVKRWEAADNPARADMLRAPTMWGEASQAAGPLRELMRQQLRKEMLGKAEADAADSANKLLLELRESVDPVVVPGNPPLRRRSVEALADVYEWLASRALGQTVQLPEGIRGELVEAVKQAYPGAAPGDQMMLTEMPAVLAWLEFEWQAADPTVRARFTADVRGALGVPAPILPPPYAGETETWAHPDGLFELACPKGWPVRHAGLAEPLTVAGWLVRDVTVLGDAPPDAIELSALPRAGAVVMTATLPAAVTEGRDSLGEAAAAFGAELLGRHGPIEPVAESAGPNSVLLVWNQQGQGEAYRAWVSVVALPDVPGAVVAIVARAPAAAAAEVEPALSAIVHGLRLGPGKQPAPSAETAPGPGIAESLVDRPLRSQMDLLEELIKGMK
jgi:hypothetical protein